MNTHTQAEFTPPGSVPPQPTPQEYQQLIESFAQAVWQTNAVGQVVEDSPTWRSYTGQTLQQWLREGWIAAVHPDQRSDALGQWQQALQDQTPFQAELRLQSHDGGWRWTNLRAIAIRQSDGLVRKWVGVCMDIHDAKTAQQGLHESEKRLRLALEATQMGTWEWNLQTNQVFWNEQHFRLFGMEPHPQPINPDWFLSHVHPDDRARITNLLQKAIEERGVYDAEFCAVREDGSQRWMSGYGRIMEEKDGKPIRMSGVMFDVDERRRAEDALRAVDQRKDEFLAMLAHELRNPMATVRNGLSILTLTGEAGSMTKQTVAMMNRQVDHLVRLVDDLLDVSRISQGKIELKRERLELGALVASAVETIRPQYETQQKSLYFSPAPSALFLNGDATRLSQVVTNLLTNGLRYTGAQGQVWVSLAEQQGQALLRVADNGIGLRVDQLAAIFELFVQVDNSLARQQGGLGVGLTLAKRLVELHEGHLEARSAGLGEGSTFTAYIPLPKEFNQEKLLNNTTASSLTNGRLLVIDDNGDAARTLSTLLTLKGFEVHTRQNGQEGIQAAEALRPAVILCDIGMPELDGYQTARFIREQPWGQRLGLIALTGYGGADDRQRAKEAGFDAHLVKPIKFEELLGLLAHLLPTGQAPSGSD